MLPSASSGSLLRAPGSPPTGGCLAPGQGWSQGVAVSTMTAKAGVVCVSVSQGPQQDGALRAHSGHLHPRGGWPSSPPSPLLASSLPGTYPIKNLLHLNLYLRASGRGRGPDMGVQSTVASEFSWSIVSLLRCHLDLPSQNAPRGPVTACPEHTAKVKLAFSSSFCSFFFFLLS